jgi:hypothetical protein
MSIKRSPTRFLSLAPVGFGFVGLFCHIFQTHKNPLARHILCHQKLVDEFIVSM